MKILPSTETIPLSSINKTNSSLLFAFFSLYWSSIIHIVRFSDSFLIGSIANSAAISKFGGIFLRAEWLSMDVLNYGRHCPKQVFQIVLVFTLTRNMSYNYCISSYHPLYYPLCVFLMHWSPTYIFELKSYELRT